jgi:hypothetical protein
MRRMLMPPLVSMRGRRSSPGRRSDSPGSGGPGEDVSSGGGGRGGSNAATVKETGSERTPRASFVNVRTSVE